MDDDDRDLDTNDGLAAIGDERADSSDPNVAKRKFAEQILALGLEDFSQDNILRVMDGWQAVRASRRRG